MSDDNGLGTDRLKHLEFIQAIVARLSNNSFLIKGWTLTVAAAFFAVLAAKVHWSVAAAGLVPLVAFWFLDGTFLRNERRFRALYDDVAQGASNVPPMSLDISRYTEKSWASATFSNSLSLFYGALIIIDVALTIAAFVRKH